MIQAILANLARSYSIGLVVWTQEVFWHMLCGPGGRECDERWLANPLTILRVAQAR
jgi:hypothetical protein